MSVTRTLAEVLAAAQNATSLSGTSVLLLNSSGDIAKTMNLVPTPNTPGCSNANEAPQGWGKTTMSTANLPASGNGGFIFSMYYDIYAGMQDFYQFDGGPKKWFRRKVGGEWESWMRYQFLA